MQPFPWSGLHQKRRRHIHHSPALIRRRNLAEVLYLPRGQNSLTGKSRRLGSQRRHMRNWSTGSDQLWRMRTGWWCVWHV